MKKTLVGLMLVLTATTAGAAPDEEIAPPTVVTRTETVAPADAVPPGGHVLVVLGVTVEADGGVGAVDVVQSGGLVLDPVAQESVRHWTFQPARRGEKAIAARFRVGIEFNGPPVPPSNPPPTPNPNPNPVPRPNPDLTPSPDPQASPAPPPSPNPATELTSEPAGDEPALNATVRGRARARSRGASDYVQVVGKLAEVPRKDAAELLKLAPGFLLTNEGGEGHAEQIFLRGFDAREGQDIELTVNGVAVNEAGNLHGNGYADLHFVIPELVESLRVVEGPFDPRQGNFAVAGSAEYELGLTQRGLTAKATTGSFGTQRLAFLWGPPGESTHTYAGVELYQTDGFGQLRDAKRGTAQAQYEGQLGENGTFRFGSSFYTTTYHSPGVVREDDYEAGKIGFYDSYDALLKPVTLQGGTGTRFSLNADLELKKGDVTHHHLVYFTASTLQLREDFTGFVEDEQTPLQNPHIQRGDLITLENSAFTFGGRGFARKRLEAFGRPVEAELGYAARVDFVHSTQYRIEASSGHPYLVDNDLSSVLGDIGLYADGNVKPLRWLTLRGGVRADLLTYDVFDNCVSPSIRRPSETNPPGDASCPDQQDLGKHREPVQQVTASGTTVMPRATLLVGPFAGFTFSGSYGIGVRSMGPVDVNADSQTAFASIQSEEVGASLEGKLAATSANLRTTLFRTHVDHDFIFNEAVGRATLANGTSRTGVAVSGRATGSFFDSAVSATWVESRYDDTDTLVAYVPDLVLRYDGTLFGPLPFVPWLRGTLGTGVTYVGRRPLPFGERSDTIFTIDAVASVGWSGYTAGVSIQNLLDTQYRLGEYNFTSDFRVGNELPSLVPARHFTAGAPRTVLFTLEANL